MAEIGKRKWAAAMAVSSKLDQPWQRLQAAAMEAGGGAAVVGGEWRRGRGQQWRAMVLGVAGHGGCCSWAAARRPSARGRLMAARWWPMGRSGACGRRRCWTWWRQRPSGVAARLSCVAEKERRKREKKEKKEKKKREKEIRKKKKRNEEKSQKLPK